MYAVRNGLSKNSGMTCGMFNEFVNIKNLKSVKEFHLNGNTHKRVFGGRDKEL